MADLPVGRYRLAAEVVESVSLPGEHHRLTLRAPEIVSSALPGQFLLVWCHSPADLDQPPSAALLRRPLSISRLRPPDRLELLLRVRGAGGRLLSRKKSGDSLDIIGPLGHGFTITPGLPMAVIIAGGIGLAPVPFLVETLVASGIRTVALTGATDDTRLPFAIERFLGRPATIPDLVALGAADVSYVSEAAEGALVVALLENRLAEFVEAGAEFFAVGPRPMVKRVAQIIGGRAPLQVSLEERMACGVGACRSCIVPMLGPRGPEYRTVCREGPVFSASEVDWERLE
jgi:dihydroorotate dehydrogenase electron transfer subunit